MFYSAHNSNKSFFDNKQNIADLFLLSRQYIETFYNIASLMQNLPAAKDDNYPFIDDSVMIPKHTALYEFLKLYEEFTEQNMQSRSPILNTEVREVLNTLGHTLCYTFNDSMHDQSNMDAKLKEMFAQELHARLTLLACRKKNLPGNENAEEALRGLLDMSFSPEEDPTAEERLKKYWEICNVPAPAFYHTQTTTPTM